MKGKGSNNIEKAKQPKKITNFNNLVLVKVK